MADIELISPGFYTSIQDTGRRGTAKYGVPQAGVMDTFSAAKANLLLNNAPNDALLEITFSGPKSGLIYLQQSVLAVLILK